MSTETSLLAEPSVLSAEAPAPVVHYSKVTRRLRGAERARWLLLVPGIIVLFVAAFGTLIAPYDPIGITGAPRLAPNINHWFGTDSVGMDVFSRTLVAAQLDFLIAASVVISSAILGVVAGLAIGMSESKRGPAGLAGRGFARFVDLLEAVPAVLIVLALVAFYGTSVPTMIVIMAVILAPIQMRLVRTEVLRVRSEAYLDAARLAGQSELQLVIKHVLPNSIQPVLENATVIFASAILLLSALGFLGVGLPPPTPEWGSMISTGASDIIVGKPWSAGAPALAVSFTVIAAVCASRFIRRR